MSLAEAARSLDIPYPTLARWVLVWYARGVEGIERVTARAHAGKRWVIDPSVLARYRDCELPAPYAR